MKLSIIIPYYNANKCIGRMLDSLLRQDMPQEEYEIIVVDDGSKEEPIVLKDYVQRYSNIHYIRQENAGPGAARNTGIDAAKGEYIFFCDSDDYVAGNVLNTLYSMAHERELDMLFHHVVNVGEKDINVNDNGHFGEITVFESGKDFFALPFTHRIHTGPCQYIISRAFLGRANLSFPVNRIMNEDSSFFIDAVLAAGKTGKVDVDAYYYVYNPDSLTHSVKRVDQAGKWTSDMMVFIKKMTEILQDKDLKKNMPQACVDNLVWIRNQKAFILLFEACRYLPSTSFNGIITELKHLGAFPKAFGRYKWLKFLFLRPVVMKVFNKRYMSKNTNN